MGRFAIDSYVVIGQIGAVKTWMVFPKLKGRQVYFTQGFKEAALLDGTVDSSYRDVARRMNRIRHQTAAGTPSTSLRDVSEREGIQIISQWIETSTHELEQCGWSTADLSTTTELRPVPVQIPSNSQVTTEDVVTAIDVADIPAEFHEVVKANPLPYGNPKQVIDICADAVLAKKQKEARRRGQPASTDPPLHDGRASKKSDPKAVRERISDKVATIHHVQRSYAFVASTYAMLLMFVVAFLLKNKLNNNMIFFFVDGEKALHQAIITAMRWHPSIFIILDWHHLVTKCAQMLSLISKGKDIRNCHLKKMKWYLWYGAVDQAIAYLQSIPSSEKKSDVALESLIGYLIKNKSHIPCYAIRKQLGLRNSSNAVEKCNDVLVSDRQKHQGMSWSKEGSLSLAALGTVDFNGFRTRWLKGGVVPLAFAATA